MKKLLIVALALVIGTATFAQRGHYGGGVRFYPRVTVIGGYSPFFNPYYSPFYPSPYYNHSARPTKLDLKIEDIKKDYNERIWAVKHDTGLTGKQRRAEVRRLKHERDNEITDAKMARYQRR
ncbi:MAG: hypothetical protein ABIQ31_14250 [Ferruginibacter sp.]